MRARPARGQFRHRQHLRERGARRKRERDGEDCRHGHGLQRRPTIAILVGSQALLPVSLRNDARLLLLPLSRRHRAVLPTLGHAVPTVQWANEIKHDGFRFICRRAGDQVRVFSRPGYDWTDRVPTIAEFVKRRYHARATILTSKRSLR